MPFPKLLQHETEISFCETPMWETGEDGPLTKLLTKHNLRGLEFRLSGPMQMLGRCFSLLVPTAWNGEDRGSPEQIRYCDCPYQLSLDLIERLCLN